MTKQCWTCGTCTLLNPATKRRCQVCNSRRPVQDLDTVGRTTIPAAANVPFELIENREKRTPRFERNSTIGVTVTTTCGTIAGSIEKLTEGLVAFVGDLEYGDNDSLTATRKITANKSRNREKSSRSRKGRKQKSSPSKSFQLRNQLNASGSILPKRFEFEVINRNGDDETTTRLQLNTNSGSDNGKTKTDQIPKLLQDQSLDDAEHDVAFDVSKRQERQEVELEQSSSSWIEKELISTAVKSIPLRLSTGKTDRVTTPIKNISKESSVVKSQRSSELVHMESDRQKKNQHATEFISQGLTQLTATMTEEVVDTNRSPAQNHVSTTAPIHSTAHPSENVCGEKSVHSMCMLDAEASTAIKLRNAVVANTGIMLSASAQEVKTYEMKQQSIDNAQHAGKDDNYSRRKDVVAKISPKEQSEFESQSSFLTCSSSRFGYTPPEICATSQSSQTGTPEESGNRETSVTKGRRQELVSTGKRRKLNEDQEQQQCEPSSPSVNEISPFFSSPRIPRTKESHRSIPTVPINEGTTPDVHKKIPECVGNSSNGPSHDNAAPTFSPARSSRIITAVVASLKKTNDLVEITDKLPNAAPKTPPTTLILPEEKVEKLNEMLKPSLSSNETGTSRRGPKTAMKPTKTGFQTVANGTPIILSTVDANVNGRVLVKSSSSSVKPTVSQKNPKGTMSGIRCSTSLSEITRHESISPTSEQSKAPTFQNTGNGIATLVSNKLVDEMKRELKLSSSSNKDEVISRKRPLSATTSSIAMFKTAGNGTLVTVAQERIEEMGRVLNESLESISEKASSLIKSGSKLLSKQRPMSTKKSPMVAFQTAGTGKAITVSSDDVKKMEKILNSSFSNETYGKRPAKKHAVATFQTAESRKSITVSREKVAEMDSTMTSIEPATKSAEAVFRTAGIGNTISISKEKIAEAERILNSSSSGKKPTAPKRKPATKPAAAIFQTAGTSALVSESKEVIHRTESILDASSTGEELPTHSKRRGKKAVLAMFQTAGSGKSIVVTKETIDEVGKILNPSTSVKKATAPLNRPANKAIIQTFQTAGSGYSSLGEEQTSLTNRTVKKAVLATFQTAGTGKSITVSKEKIAKMEQMLNSSSSSFKEPTECSKKPSRKPEIANFQTAGTGKSIAVSKEKIAEMEQMLNSSSSSVMEPTECSKKTSRKTLKASFQTAGTGKFIAVSKEKIAEMERMLNSSSSSVTELIECSKKTSRKPAMASFQTAGTGKSIAVSKEKIAEMEKMLSFSSSNKETTECSKRFSRKPVMATFQTAGTGKSISVSQEMIAEMEQMLNSSSSYKEPNVPVKRPPAKAVMVTYHTKGSGISMKKLEERADEARQILNSSSSVKERTEDIERLSKKRATASLETGGISISIPLSKKKEHEMGKILKGSSSGNKQTVSANISAHKAMFKTAGSGSSIKVSQEKIDEVTRLLTESPKSSKHLAQSKPSIKMFKSKGFEHAGDFVSVDTSDAHDTAAETEVNSSSIDDKMVGKNCTEGSIILSSFKRPRKGNDSPNASVPMTVLDKKEGKSSMMYDNFSLSTTNADVLSSTPLVSTKTPRTVTDMKTESKKLPAMFQTAGAGKTLQVSEERVKAMGVLLDKRSSFIEQSSLKESQNHATNSFRNGHLHSQNDSIEVNLRLYPHSPLRTNEGKGTKVSPHTHFVKGDSLRRITYGMTPSISKSNFVPKTNHKKKDTLLLPPPIEDHEQYENGNRIALQTQDSPCSPKGSKRLSRSTNANIPDDIRIRKPEAGQNADLTPVPIDFNIETSMKSNVETRASESKTMESSNFSDCQTLSDAIRDGIMSNSVMLCRSDGVSEVTIMVNCNNALQLRFGFDGKPKTFEKKGEELSSKVLGRMSDIRKSLVDKGCDSNRIKCEWIRNHTRWIVWKLASYERRFSKFLAGRYLTYHNLVENLERRFQTEIIRGVRPAVRKILNRDISAGKMVVLVVCQILSPCEAKGDEALPKSSVLELSDGWYSIKSCLDSKLSEYVNNGLITIGTKLLVSGARLVGAVDGVDPLDECDGTSCQNLATLQLSANATRLARWDAKLGFVNELNRIGMPLGKLLVKRISDVLPGGGNIPAIRLFVQRIYPMLYFEKSEHPNPCDKNSVLPIKRRVFTEQEEDSRRRAFEGRKLRVIEKMVGRIQGEVEQEIDESAPSAWKRMMKSSAPEDIFVSLSKDEKSIVSKWQEKRSYLIQRRVREEVESELETDPSLTRESTNFLRVEVHSIDPKTSCDERAMLTIWQPSAEQLGVLKEGTTVEIHNTAVRESTYDGIVQLVANNRTNIEPFSFQVSSLAQKIGYQQRRFLSLFHVHSLSHKVANTKGKTNQNKNFDVAAVQVHVHRAEPQDNFFFYLTDETYLLLRVRCLNPPSVLKTLLVSEKQSFPSYALRDLVIKPFDEEHQCAVAEFTEMSSVVMTNDRLENLSKWVASLPKEIRQLSSYVKLDLPFWENDLNAKIYLGYVIALRSDNAEKFCIQVDCCGQGSFEWNIPVDILRHMISEISSEEMEDLFSNRERQAERISSFFRARGILWRFQLLSAQGSVVCSATEVNKYSMAKLYETMQQ